MEDSEKRKERLKAMRAMAAQAEAEASTHVQTSAMSGFLANPLLESPANLASTEEPGSTQRFDFYTDPMAAFSANKKRTATGNQPAQVYFRPQSNSAQPMAPFSFPGAGPRKPDTTLYPASQMPGNYPPAQRMHQGQGPHNGGAPYRSRTAGPLPMHHGTPNAWNVPGGGAGYHSPAPYRGTTSPYPIHEGNRGFQPAGTTNFSHGQGRPPWYGNSTSPGSLHAVRSTQSRSGPGQWHTSGSGQYPGQGAGRGRGFHHGSVSGEAFRPESFYDKSMVEDPWEHLDPVLWKVLEVPASSNSWLPKSIGMKKPRVSESFSNSNSKQSLAEYLAASFNEATKDAPSI